MRLNTGLAKLKMVRPSPGSESWSSEGEGATSVLTDDSGTGCVPVVVWPKPSDFGILVDRDGNLEIDRTLVNSKVINEEFAEIRKDFQRNGFFFDQRLKPSKSLVQRLQPTKLPMQPSIPLEENAPKKKQKKKHLEENAPKKRKKKKHLVLKKGLK